MRNLTTIFRYLSHIATCTCIALSTMGLGNHPINASNIANPNIQMLNSPHSPRWLEKLKQLEQGENIKFRIIQLGDSHTAADYFTDELRKRLQAAWGDGGIGWVYPNKVSGQRMAQIHYSNDGWETLTIRKDQTVDFPLGGILARSLGKNTTTITPHTPSFEQYFATFSFHPIFIDNPILIRDAIGNTHYIQASENNHYWQYQTLPIRLPITYQTIGDHDIWEIGFINLENNKAGVVVSAMGINGAQFSQINKWRPGWTKDLEETKADLIILSYGTNEAFNNQLDIASTQKEWINTIHLIQDTLPNAGILILGAPESLINTQGSCGTRAPQLDNIQTIQKSVAQSTHALYWSWETAMGGRCSMKKYIANNLARKDGVHFSANGYSQLADQLANELIQLVRQPIH